MIIRNGNKAYDGLKLIEPICNLRMTELAQKERPKIPLFTEFKEHILRSIDESQNNRAELEDLFKDIIDIDNPDLVLAIYGAFRHWGHPFLDYMEGLKKLHQQTTIEKVVDKDYAEKLASDLSYLVLKDQFNKTKKWSLDISKVSKNHPLYDVLSSNTWPTPFQVKDFGDKWHTLPIIKCFEIPDVIDPSLIYADKSHSYTFSELKDHIIRHPDLPVPSHKVLKSFLEKPATDWKAFLEQVNNQGLDIEDLIIGLRGKEREIKIIGRFFSLMSWKLRDYFVITEYLIKLHYVPLFSGLTMADDLNTVMKKMLDTSNGQGLTNYDYITIANC